MLRRKRLADLPEHWDFGELTPGAQVRVRRSRYYHHGIYIGNGEMVHFDGSPADQGADAAAVRVRRTGMEEFLRGGLPELRIYGRAERKMLRAPDEIARLATLAVCARENEDWDALREKAAALKDSLGATVELVQGDSLTISSTELRQGGALRCYTPESVADYIEEKHLYGY